VRIIAGPGKSQIARVTSYDGEERVIQIDVWLYDKTWFEKVWDQDDENLQTVEPTEKSWYMFQYQDAVGHRGKLHVKGKAQGAGNKVITLSGDAPELDVLTGKGILITDGTGKGQRALIKRYDAARRQAHIDEWEVALPDKSSSIQIVRTEFDEIVTHVRR